MKSILDKIDAYNFFNYLLPGVLFAVMLEQLTQYSIKQEDLIIGAFVYYFTGLVISRFGSLIIEPFLKKISFLQFAPYADFICASQKDKKIEILSRENNMYRTFVSLFILLIFVKVYELVAKKYHKYHILNEQTVIIVILVLFIGFLLSYRKQSNYIYKRIIEVNKK